MTINFNLPCANGDCPKRLDGKCSIWNAPNKATCRDYENGFTTAAVGMSRLAKAMAVPFNLFSNVVNTASEFQRDLAKMESLQSSLHWPVGGMVPQRQPNCGHLGETVTVNTGRLHATPPSEMERMLNDAMRGATVHINTPSARDASDAMFYAMSSAMDSLGGDKPVKKITLKEALDLSILLWDDLAESGEGRKDRSVHYNKVRNFRQDCPMCEYYIAQSNNGCTACPLKGCTKDGSLFGNWADNDWTEKEYRKQAAKNLSQRLKDFRAEKFPEGPSRENPILMWVWTHNTPDDAMKRWVVSTDKKGSCVALVNMGESCTQEQARDATCTSIHRWSHFRPIDPEPTAKGNRLAELEEELKDCVALRRTKWEIITPLQNEVNTLTLRELELKAEIKAEKDKQVKKLFVSVGGDHNGQPTLYIGYGSRHDTDFDVVAQLNNDRTFEALSNVDNLQSYTEWVKDGERVDETVVEWKERFYKLSEKGKLYSLTKVDYVDKYKKDNGYTNIYDFSVALPACNCKDPNVITTEHNKRVVIF